MTLPPMSRCFHKPGVGPPGPPPPPPSPPALPLPSMPPRSMPYNFSLPYSIYYNNAGNYPQKVYDPGNASQYGFIVDDSGQHHVGTASFGFDGDPLWPNFLYTTGAASHGR